MPSELAKSYDARQVEAEIQPLWDAARCWHAEPDPSKKPFVIVIPPPNVTAALHLGHALNNTVQDILVRWHRMLGDNAVWIPGTDHAGIATQTVVEKRLLKDEGKRRTDYTREEFVARVQAWKDEYEAKIIAQLKAMGCSCDWDRTAFTMDADRSDAVREAFFRLFRDGLIYRGKRLVNWDPVTQTALADDEVEMEEVDGFFYYLKYPLEDGSGHITVATTRPETMLGDTAVAINPKDPRAADLRGKRVVLPIVGRVIPIIEDDYVVLPVAHGGDPADTKAQFATGFLKVTPAHDPNDEQLGIRHKLEVINVMAPDARISRDHGWHDFGQHQRCAVGCDATLHALIGQSREQARETVVKWLKDHNLLEEKKPYRHSVGHSYRSHVPIEPYLSDQWYIAVQKPIPSLASDPAHQGHVEGTTVPKASLAGLALTALRERGLDFVPERYEKTYETWNANLRDWCISRQLWWGHRIPIWHKDGQYHLEPVDGATQDPDVLDTWFSSALWPLSTLGWPSADAPELRSWNPTSVLCTAREIITLWVSRMVMFNRYLRADADAPLPFKDVFIHAMIQDGHGQKMSKSLGNGVDPLDIIASHGTDAMRFTLCSMTTHTQDVRLPVDCIDPHTGETVTPKYVNDSSGYQVAAPIQEYKGKRFASSYGQITGTAPADLPVARNTSSKFDLGKAFCNKLWNAARFVMMQLGSADASTPSSDDTHWSVIDRWLISRLVRTIEQSNQSLADYRFDQYAKACYDFVWRDYCDWYLEAAKPAMRDPARRASTARVLATALDVALRLMHPAIPFVTEKLYTALRDTGARVGIDDRLPCDRSSNSPCMTSAYPILSHEAKSLLDEQAESTIEKLQAIVSAIRELRNSQKLDPKRKLPVTIQAPPDLAAQILDNREFVEGLSQCVLESVGSDATEPPSSAKTTAAGCTIFIAGVVDASSSDKRRSELEKTISALRGRLSNESYIAKAPAKLVDEKRQQLADAERELQQLI